MKYSVCILLVCTLLLSGCGGAAAPAESPSASLEAGKVIGRSYIPEGRLPREVTDMKDAVSQGLTEQGVLWRAAESPDGHAALYRLGEDAVLVEWDGAVAMFNGWVFGGAQGIAPEMAVLDVKGTGEADTLVIRLYTGGGTGVSKDALHLLTRDGHGSLTDYPLPEALYAEELARQITVDPKANTLTLGPMTLALPAPEKGFPYDGTVGLGSWTVYSVGIDGELEVTLSLDAGRKNTAVPAPVGSVRAAVSLDEATGIYSLSNISIGAY